MKRPFAVIGFSMLLGSLIIVKLSLKMTIALIIGTMVTFCFLLVFKKVRKDKTLLFVLICVAIYALSFLITEIGYFKAKTEIKAESEFTGIVCETPKISDNAFTYIIKPDNKNYKIRYVSQGNYMISEGDRVNISIVLSEDSYNDEFFENSLSSRIYFTIFETDESSIEKTGERNLYYSTVGKVKNWVFTTIDTYLPNEIGAIAKAMTIGERSGIKQSTIETFNYSGVSHILVISGLHLSIWILGLLKILEKVCKSDKVIVLTGLIFLLMYSALIGFSASVVRAGVMVAVTLLGRLFHREADSINSVGMAVAIILIANPFAVRSVSFWLTVLSTMGILILPQKIIHWIKQKYVFGFISKSKFLMALIELGAISVSVAIFTLPVFIVKIKMIPVLTFVANLLIVDLALLFMVMTVIAVILHGIHLFTLSKSVFLLIGTLGNAIKFFAEKIGMSQWSTLSVSHGAFKVFLWVAIVALCVAFMLKRFNKNIVKNISVVLTVAFILISVYIVYYDYHNPSIDIKFAEDKPIILANSHDKTVMVGLHDDKYFNFIKTKMNSHNKKSLDLIMVCDETVSLSALTTFYDEFGITETYFYGKSPELLNLSCNDNMESLVLDGDTRIDLQSSNEIVITCKNKKILFLDCGENVFKNNYDYDIIFLYGENSAECYEDFVPCVNANTTEVIVADETMDMTIYFEQ